MADGREDFGHPVREVRLHYSPHEKDRKEEPDGGEGQDEEIQVARFDSPSKKGLQARDGELERYRGGAPCKAYKDAGKIEDGLR